MTMVVIDKFTYCISMFATKLQQKLKKTSLKRQFLLLFQDDKKEYISLIWTFPLKNRRFFSILPTKFINLNSTASQKFQSKHIFFLIHFRPVFQL